MHNGGGYDLNLFLKDVTPDKKNRVYILPKGATKYYVVRVGRLAFKDSIHFLPFSLDKLSKSLTGENGRMNLTITMYLMKMKKYSDELVEKTMGKGSFPYESVNSLESFDKVGVPPKDWFRSSITGEISDEKYAEVCNLYEDPSIVNLKNLHDIYLLKDVGILADCFEFYRDFSIRMWGLDPANYITSPSMNLDGALKESAQELDLISDPNLYEMLEKSICGGFVTVVKRRTYANNIYIEPYNPDATTNFIFSFDFNGLYAGIQQEYLPVGNFKELNAEERAKFTQNLINRKVVFGGDIGYFIELDYHIPDDVKLKTDELPLSLYVADCIRGSDYMRRMLNGKPTPKGAKLVATHLPMKKAVFHIKWLDLLIGLDLKVDKIHRVWSFDQKPFLCDYVTKNIEKRADEENPLLKNILKLASNAPYGKLLEQKRKRNVRASFISTKKGLRKAARSPFYRGYRRLGNNKCIVESYTKKVLLNVPIYVGNTILQLAKFKYWDFFYNVLKPAFGDDVRLLYGDTDSLLLEFIVPPHTTLDKLINESVLKEYIDMSNFTDPKLKHDRFKGKSGYLKSETGQDMITSAIMLKPKLYSIKTVKGTKTALKGVSMANVQPVPHEKFEEILDDSTVSEKREQVNIRKIGENMCTIKSQKETINAYENKRWWADTNTSYAYGHPTIRDLPGGNECHPVRFESNVVAPIRGDPIHVENEDDEWMDEELWSDQEDGDALDILISAMDEDERITNLKRKSSVCIDESDKKSKKSEEN